MENIKVSIIIPIYKQEKKLHACMENLLSQSLNDIEIICLIKHCADVDFEILSEYSWKDKRINIIDLDYKDIAEARNVGIREAKGEFLAFVDPNDKYNSYDILEILYKKAKDNAALICGGGISEMPEVGKEDKVKSGGRSMSGVYEDQFYFYRDYQHDGDFYSYIYNSKFIKNNELCFSSNIDCNTSLWFVGTMHKAGRFFGVSEKVCSYGENPVLRDCCNNVFTLSQTINGVIEVARFAKENGYKQLLNLENKRISRDLADYIYPYICEDDENILDLLCGFEDVTGFEHVENKILINVLKERDLQLAAKTNELENVHKNVERLRIDNGALKRMIDSQQSGIKQLNDTWIDAFEEIGIRINSGYMFANDNLLPYPYVETSHEKDGIKWTDLGDGRIEAVGTAEDDTSFELTPLLDKSVFKTNNKRYIISTGAANTSSFTWYMTGWIANKNERHLALLLRDAVINDTDGFAERFEVDTSGYDYFGRIFISVKKGRTLDHVIFKPEVRPVD